MRPCQVRDYSEGTRDPIRYTSAMRGFLRFTAGLAALLLATGCDRVWNDPYPAADAAKNIYYSAFVERPKHLDPAVSYSEDEGRFTQQVYEPPLQYQYLERPYRLVPLTAAEMPRVSYEDAQGNPVPESSPALAYSVYEVRIKPGILFQPHPAFARDAAGTLLYQSLSRQRIEGLASPYALPARGTREVTADDYIYEIKRLASPRLHSPIYGLMSEYIVGLGDLAERLRKRNEAMMKEERGAQWLDLRDEPLTGVERVDAHTFRVKLKGRYPQFLYWLAMPFFAPMPWEADKFFSQSGMAEKNFTLDWWPVGTGPYMLTEYNPNSRIVLERNPNFRGEPYPEHGAPGDRAAGLLADAGKAMPFIDRAVYSREKESIPYWNKFLQGYYDASGISSDSFDQAVRVNVSGDVALTDEMRDKGIRLLTSVKTSTFYMGFNMLDPVVGGLTERATKLRQAISIAVDQEEYISIFQNGRGIAAQSPLPPGIFGYEGGVEGSNTVVYDWVDGKRQRKPQAERGAFARLGMDPDASLVTAHDAQHRRQPQPATRELGGEKGIEDAWLHIGRNPFPIINDFEQDDAAKIFLPTHRRALGYVFQEGRLLPHLSVRQNLLYGRRFAGRSGEGDLGHVVSLLGLAALLERRPQDLSGGEKQRVAIGRALLAEPRLLLMDEPLAALDAPRKSEILYYVERLRDELGVPIVYVSHALDEVVRLADTLVVMSEGRVLESGPVSETMARMELRPFLGRFEGGAVIEARVAEHDLEMGLARLEFAGIASLRVAGVDDGRGDLAQHLRVPAERPGGGGVPSVARRRRRLVAVHRGVLLRRLDELRVRRAPAPPERRRRLLRLHPAGGHP